MAVNLSFRVQRYSNKSVSGCVHSDICIIHPGVMLVPGEQRLTMLPSGPLFPGPGSEGGGQCFGPVLPVWELSVGAWGLWSGTNVSITSRLSASDYKSFGVQTQHSCLHFQ